MTTRKLLGVGIALISALGALAASPGAAAASIKLVPVLTGLSSPLFVTNARDGTNRLFVVEQAGIVKLLQQGTTAPTVFLNITSKVLSGGERGLLGLAFHPQFASNRRFFVNYTRPPDGATVIAEYRVSPSDPNLADSTETVLSAARRTPASRLTGSVGCFAVLDSVSGFAAATTSSPGPTWTRFSTCSRRDGPRSRIKSSKYAP